MGEVDKAVVLALVDELTLEEAKKRTLAVSHSEDVSIWVSTILAKLKSLPQRLIDLQQQLQAISERQQRSLVHNRHY